MTYEFIDDGRRPGEQPGIPFPSDRRGGLRMAYSAICAERAERSDMELGTPTHDIVSSEDCAPIPLENIVSRRLAVTAALNLGGAGPNASVGRKIGAVSAGFQNPGFLQELKRLLG